MYSAISNLGAGGTQDVALSDTANGVHYGIFALMGVVSGSVNNILGPRSTLFLGTLGYALYVGALWCFQSQGVRWFLIFGAAVQGVTAALLWSAQGSIMMSYPLERDKGKAFAIFWAIFQLGSFVGSIIALAINLRDGKLSAVSTSTYVAFLVIILSGVASSLLVLPPHRVVRGDGTIVTISRRTFPGAELKSMAKMLSDWRVLALLPMFFASNYFYAYQGAVNAGMFDGSTRALNASLEGAGAIVGALLIGFLVLDTPSGRLRYGRRSRGYFGLAVVVIMTLVVWSVALGWQTTFTRSDAATMRTSGTLINYHDSNYPGKGTLYFFYYFNDACYQALAYWIMSAVTNDPFRLARLAGIYKAVQSAGSAGSFGMDAVGTPYLNELLASCLIMLVSFPLAFLVIRTVKETNYEFEEVIYVNNLKPDAFESGELPSAATHPDKVAATKPEKASAASDMA
ncbi:hypothetical protein PUNSTDRAFT_62537 [Punctularia strigosozonata HHB-11173 SS5]|uniref:uncharacterized protein n=1 Tax=Punctularia strigosozonata (strain HHB-11173) TaxID=741275 RepID=UPI0004418127|nr:uncharacterized protein PUNSTDRAFT_62537 [Punctularia strigosozonata HHB-11173 SS5]EIN11194.1 hypothetical protein PUNSTDRAFT_62537 [Punctularia strigosozonata HHB-11173 SS5]